MFGFAVGAASVGWMTSVQETAVAPKDNRIFSCAMHPEVQQTEPGACPICGMDLVELEPSRSQSTVRLSARAKALSRLRTSVVGPAEAKSAQLILLGQIEPDETSLKTVTAWTGGRIDRLRIASTGQKVSAGQVVATLYSPDVFSAHQDLLAARGQVEALALGTEASQESARHALIAARERLRLIGIPKEELRRLEEETKPTGVIAVKSPYSGTVTKRVLSEGAYVQTGAPLLEVARLKSVWVQLDAYENDLARLQVGQVADITIDALRERRKGTITFIEPSIDEARRTAKVRVAISNDELRLLPGMFVKAAISVQPEHGTTLVIPSTAPLFTGRRSVVYVETETEDGFRYDPRTVRLGPKLGGTYPVVSGLSQGERIVTKGAFRLDADLQIHGGPSMMTLSPIDIETTTLTEQEKGQVASIVEVYLQIQTSLAKDQLQQAQKAAFQLMVLPEKVAPLENHRSWSHLSEGLSHHAEDVVKASDLEQARHGFEHLSQMVILLLHQFGNPTQRALRLAFCPMALGSEGALWLQESSEVENAYFGASMYSCGNIQQLIEPGSYLELPEGIR